MLELVNARLALGGRKRDFDWAEEVVVVTGGAGGLGLLLAEVYGMRGVTVAVLDVKDAPDGGEARNVTFYKCDVGDREQVARAAERIEKEVRKKKKKKKKRQLKKIYEKMKKMKK